METFKGMQARKPDEVELPKHAEVTDSAKLRGGREGEGDLAISRRVLLAGAAALAVGASARTATAAGGGHEHHHHDHGGGGAHALIRSAADCQVAGEICEAHCQAMLATGDTSLADCSAAVREMLAGCSALTKLAAIGSKHLPEMAKLCHSMLEDCKAECDKHKDHDECKACAKACEGCIAECKKVMS